MRSEHHITSGRASLFAETVGRGDPVVFLHAAVCDRRMWEAQTDQVAESNTAIAYDRRGHGRTHAEAESYSAVADLMAVLDTLAEGKPAILVGCSQGARVALDAALLHPSRMRGLVLVSPTVAGAADPVHSPAVHELMEELKRVGASGDQERINALKARLFLDGPFENEGRVQGAARKLFLEMNGAILSAPYRGSSIDNVAAYQRLREIRVPALVLWGACDFPHIRARSRQVAASLPYGTGTELAGTAHLPSLDRPAELNARLLAFLAGEA